MYYSEFQGIRIAALAAAVPDNHESVMDYARNFSPGVLEKFCKATGIQKRYNSSGIGTTTADLCVVAANEIFSHFCVDKDTIDGIILLTQTPDYLIPPTSCIIQHRLGMDKCGLVYDSNIGCSAFPFGIQMACANILAGCKRILLLVGDSEPHRGRNLSKDALLFGDCGIAAIIEKTDEDIAPIKVGIHTIGKGYKTLFTPYGQQRHPIEELYRERGIEYALGYNNIGFAQKEDVFTFSIKDVPKITTCFLGHFHSNVDEADIVSIHQANKITVETIAKRMNISLDRVPLSLDRYGNTRGASTAINICDYVTTNGISNGIDRVLNISFGVGLNIALAIFDMDMSYCLPIVRTREVFNDEITPYTFF